MKQVYRTQDEGLRSQKPNFIRKTKNTLYRMPVSVPLPKFCEKLLPHAKFY